MTIRWLDNSEHYENFLKFAAKECSPYPVPPHEPMILLRAEVEGYPGFSIWTTEPYIVRTWVDNPFGFYMNAPEAPPPRPKPEIVVKHEVRIRYGRLDERHPFETREELEALVLKRVGELIPERLPNSDPKGKEA